MRFYDFLSVRGALFPSILIVVPLCISIVDGPIATSSNGRAYNLGLDWTACRCDLEPAKKCD
jgi:hypothetical protein